MATDGSGVVTKGATLTRSDAETRRRAGLDVVVCGPDEGANWQVARAIERAVSPSGHRPKAHAPHGPAPNWLPHFQQQDKSLLAGHAFYETEGTAIVPARRAR